MGFVLHPRLMADTAVIVDWSLSRVLLMNDKRFPWIVLVPRRPNVVEFFDLDETSRAQLTNEIARAGERLKGWARTHGGADKINVGMIGNLVPQLHVHVVARKKGDAVVARHGVGCGPAGALRGRRTHARGGRDPRRALTLWHGCCEVASAAEQKALAMTTEMLSAARAASPSEVLAAIKSASRETGSDFAYLLATAQRESNLDNTAKSKGSSAAGLFQFIDQTWLSLIKRHGGEHGLGQYADAISRTDSGRLVVGSPRRSRQFLPCARIPKFPP